ncbi:MAG: hypothetical protein ACJ790_18740 [Myxococcaceae bacterium]
MKRLAVLLGALLLGACGGPAAQVAGNYSGQSSILISNNAGENQNASEFVTVTQSGGEIDFNVASCAMKAFSDSTSTFHVQSTKCTRTLNTASWVLNITDGTVNGSSNNFSMTAKGTATSGSQTGDLTFTFSGTKSNF